MSADILAVDVGTSGLKLGVYGPDLDGAGHRDPPLRHRPA